MHSLILAIHTFIYIHNLKLTMILFQVYIQLVYLYVIRTIILFYFMCMHTYINTYIQVKQKQRNFHPSVLTPVPYSVVDYSDDVFDYGALPYLVLYLVHTYIHTYITYIHTYNINTKVSQLVSQSFL